MRYAIATLLAKQRRAGEDPAAIAASWAGDEAKWHLRLDAWAPLEPLDPPIVVFLDHHQGLAHIVTYISKYARRIVGRRTSWPPARRDGALLFALFFRSAESD